MYYDVFYIPSCDMFINSLSSAKVSPLVNHSSFFYVLFYPFDGSAVLRLIVSSVTLWFHTFV